MQRIERKARQIEKYPKWSWGNLKYNLWWLGVQYWIFSGSYCGEPAEIIVGHLTVWPILGYPFFLLCRLIIRSLIFLIAFIIQTSSYHIYNVVISSDNSG